MAQRILTMGRRCRPCQGDGGDPEAWQALLFAALVVIPAAVFGFHVWFHARGVRVVSTHCAWDGAAQEYVAHIQLQNQEPLFKLALVRVQGHFRPPRGRKWPAPALQARYEAISTWERPELEPHGETDLSTRFHLPGMRAFDCRAEVWVVGQHKFKKRPNPELIMTLPL